jgi:hypothetical protein
VPVPPEKPLPGDCCGSGCVRCVWDIYFDELDAYDKALAAHAAASVGVKLVPKGAPTPQYSSPSKGQEPRSPFGGLHLLPLLPLPLLLPLLL